MRQVEEEMLRLADERRIRVRRFSGQGDELVLLHGCLDSVEGWDELAGRLQCPVTAVELSGFGCSDLPRQATAAAYASDVAEVLDQLGVDRFRLLGHSLGGMAATELAETRPERVIALGLLAPVGFAHLRLAEVAEWPGVHFLAVKLAPLLLSHRLPIRWIYWALITHFVWPREELVERILRDRAAEGAILANRSAAIAGRSRQAFFRRRLRYRGPVLLAWGQMDRLLPRRQARGVIKALPQSKSELWPGVGHHPQYERPDLAESFARRLLACGEPIEWLPGLA